MLRCRYALVRQDGQMRVDDLGKVLPRLSLVEDVKVAVNEGSALAAMEWGFDPSRTVILESAPHPPPRQGQTGPAGQVRLVDSSTDHLTIEAEMTRPAVLVVTDGYSRGWRAVALPGSVQDRYEVLPANYVLRAVPLGPGRHRFRLEYSPWGFRVGRWVSGASAAVLLGLAIGCVWRRRSARPAAVEPPAD